MKAATAPLLGLLLGVLALAQPLLLTSRSPEADAPAGPKPTERLVRLTIRVVGTGEDAYLELPLAQSDERQKITAERLLSRGFQVEEVERDGNRLAILTYPKLSGPKRITYEFRVSSLPGEVEVLPTPVTSGDPSEEDWLWLRPTKQLQSSSPLIRERLIHFATPRLAAGETDAIRIAWELAATGYKRKANGSRTVLKATRVGHASDIGLDRLFATFLRTSGVPARPVIGVDIGKLKKKSHLARWVEVKSGERWAPMSVARDQYGRLPARFVKLAHGDRPFLVRSGVKSLSFRWKLEKIPEPAEVSP